MKKDKEILKKHCPSMDDLFLDDNGKQFRKRVLVAMNEYAWLAFKYIAEEWEAEGGTLYDEVQNKKLFEQWRDKK